MFKLKELRIQSGIKRSDFSKEIGINAGTIANYENEIRQAPYDLLIKFSEFFGVTVDFLLGREDDIGVLSPGDMGNQKFLTKEEKALLSLFRNLSSKAKNRVIEYIELWSNACDKNDE